MALVDDLIDEATVKILGLQFKGGVVGQDEIKKELRDLVEMNPGGISRLSRMTNDLKDFAARIDAKKTELRSFVGVYPAVFGLSVPWETVLTLWAYEPYPDPADLTKISPRVTDALGSLFRGYMRWVAT